MGQQNHAPTYKKNERHAHRSRAEEKVAIRNARHDVQQITTLLLSTLAGMGFTVHRCDSKTTASTYLCIDYGLGNTVRISDHPDVRRRRIRYNILTCQEGRYEEHGVDYDRYYYPPEDVDRCAADIVSRVGERIKQLGTAGYLAEKDRLKAIKEGRPGFWENSEEVEGYADNL